MAWSVAVFGSAGAVDLARTVTRFPLDICGRGRDSMA